MYVWAQARVGPGDRLRFQSLGDFHLFSHSGFLTGLEVTDRIDGLASSSLGICASHLSSPGIISI